MRAGGGRELQRPWIVGIQHGPIGRLLLGKNARLRRRIFVDGRVAIEVVGREVEQHRDPRLERLRALELKTARLDDVDRLFRRGLDLRAQRQADVAADEDAVAAGLEHAAGQRRGRRLPFRPGDGDDAAAQPAGRELELARDRNARASGGLDRREV